MNLLAGALLLVAVTASLSLPGGCLNCGATFTVRSRFGDKPPLYVDCPHCGVADYSWRVR